MRREQAVAVCVRIVIAVSRRFSAPWGSSRHFSKRAAHGGTGRLIALLSALALCAPTMLGCGDERPPWSGFPIFPSDAGGFELSPELASGLLAAQAAFVQQLAQQGASDAGQAASGTTDPAAVGRASAGNAAPAAPKPASREDDEPKAPGTPSMRADAATATKDMSAPTTPHEDASLDAGAAASGGASAPRDADSAASGATTPLEVDAGTALPTADAGMLLPAAGSTSQPAADAAGSTSPPAVDAGMSVPAADSGMTPAVDAGVSMVDADGGS